MVNHYPKVTIIVLNWNNYKDTSECLNGLEKTNYPNFNILIIDNDSTDGSGKLLKERYSNRHDVIINSMNSGYTGGNNIGIKAAMQNNPEYILIMNNDTVVSDPDYLSKMIKFINDKNQIGILGPKIVSHDGKRTFTEYFSSKWWKKIESKFSLNVDKYGNKARISTRLLGAVLLIRTDLIKSIGMFDEKFFMYCEEDDLSLRALINKYDVVYYPETVVFRKTENDGEEYNRRSTYYIGRNKVLMLRKNLKGTFKVFMLFYNLVGEIKRFLNFVVHRKFKVSFYHLKGVIDGYLNTNGKNRKIR